MTDVEVLEDWGVSLREDELVREFFVADVDEKAGFIAITSQRFIFAAGTGNGSSVIQEHLLSAARDAEIVRRGLRRSLRVTWHGAESLIRTFDRSDLSRLQHYLNARA